MPNESNRQSLLRVGDWVIVAVPYKQPCAPELGRLHGPIDKVKLHAWAARRWGEAEVVEDEEGAWLVAVFRGGDAVKESGGVAFGESDEDRMWLRDLTVAIVAVDLPRRRPPFPQTVTARLSAADPLRKQLVGSFGVYTVRVLWNALQFDEHRKFRWRLEHKLVQARIFNHYLGQAFPASWGVAALVRRGLGPPLVDALLAGELFAKEALGHLSGDYGEAEARPDVLRWLTEGGEVPPEATLVDETWLVQERIAIEREYRVHSLEDVVLPDMTFDRYGPYPVPEGRDEVNAYVAALLAQVARRPGGRIPLRLGCRPAGRRRIPHHRGEPRRLPPRLRAWLSSEWFFPESRPGAAAAGGASTARRLDVQRRARTPR